MPTGAAADVAATPAPAAPGAGERPAPSRPRVAGGRTAALRDRRRRGHPRGAALAARYRRLPGRAAAHRRADAARRARHRRCSPPSSQRLALGLVARRPAASGCRCPARSPTTTGPCSSTRPCPAASSATCTARCGTGRAPATSAAGCGPWSWNGPPARLALVAVGVPVLLTLDSPVLHRTRHALAVLGPVLLGVAAVVLAVRMRRPRRPVPEGAGGRGRGAPRGPAVRARLAEAREAAARREAWAGRAAVLRRRARRVPRDVRARRPGRRAPTPPPPRCCRSRCSRCSPWGCR